MNLKKDMIHVRLSTETKEELKKLAISKDTSINSLINQAIKELLKKRS